MPVVAEAKAALWAARSAGGVAFGAGPLPAAARSSVASRGTPSLDRREATRPREFVAGSSDPLAARSFPSCPW